MSKTKLIWIILFKPLPGRDWKPWPFLFPTRKRVFEERRQIIECGWEPKDIKVYSLKEAK